VRVVVLEDVPEMLPKYAKPFSVAALFCVTSGNSGAASHRSCAML
jgi:hypothetical protein